MLAADHVGHGAVCGENHGGRERVLHQGLCRQAVRVAHDLAHAAELGQFPAQFGGRDVLSVDAHCQVAWRERRPAVGPRRGVGVGDAACHSRHGAVAGRAAVEEELQHRGPSLERLRRHGLAVEIGEQEAIRLAAQQRAHRSRGPQRFQAFHAGRAVRNLERERLGRHVGIQGRTREIDHYRHLRGRARLPGKERGIRVGGHLHAAQNPGLTVDPEFEQAVRLGDFQSRAGPPLDPFLTRDPCRRCGVTEHEIDRVVGEQERQLQGAAGLPLGERGSQHVVGEQLIEVEPAWQRRGEHLSRYAAHGGEQRVGRADDADVVGLDADAIGADEGHAQRHHPLGHAAVADDLHGDAGIVAVGGRRAVVPCHFVEHAAGRSAAAAQQADGDGRHHAGAMTEKVRVHAAILPEAAAAGPEHSQHAGAG